MTGRDAARGGAAAPRRRRQPLDLTNPATVRAVTRRFAIGSGRRLGQHFLVDRAVLEQILEALQPTSSDEVFEIGSGIGTLTVELARRARRVVAVDVDDACLRAAAVTLRECSNARAMRLDARHADPVRDAGLPEVYLAAGSLPYRYTGPILGHLLELDRPPRRGVFLVQREVAARLSAGAGDWSLATVAIRSLADVERLADIGRDAFSPPPEVTSSIIRVTPAPTLPRAERAAVLDVARAAFQLRRKTLRHGVTRALEGDRILAARALEAAQIDPGRRPGALDLEEWRQLARRIVEARETNR